MLVQKFKLWKIFSITLILCTNCFTSKETADIQGLLPLLMNSNIKILIIGDSLSERSKAFRLQEKLGSSYELKDISVSGRDVRIWLSNREIIQENKADIVIVNLGTNDASYYPTEDYPRYYSELIDYLASIANWKVILTLVPPTNDNILKNKISINNQWIKGNYPNHTKVDLQELFDKNKSLPLYPSADPIHPNPIGYEIIGTEYQRVLSGLSN